MNSLSRTRALGRVAWRDARRHRGRTALVLAMIAVPVAALTMGLLYFSASEPTAAQQVADQLGTADLAVLPSDGGDPDALAAVAEDAPPGTAVTVRTSVTGSAVVDGRLQHVVVDDVLPDDPVLAPRVELRHGRLPTRPREALVSPAVRDAFGVDVGDELALDEPDLTLTVTGIVRRPERLGDPLVLVPPGSLDDVDGATVSGVFLDLPAGVGADAVPVSGDLVVAVPADFVADPYGERPVKLGSSFGLAALGLAETGLVVASAFVVGTRRRLRTVGLVAAVGGEPRHARTMVLLEGLVLGLMGSVLGVALGALAMQALAGRVQELVGRVTDGTVLPPGPTAGAIALGTVAAVLAVLAPARLVGRIPPVEALAGRTPPPAPPRRMAGRGAVVALAGALVVAAGARMPDELVQAVGLAAMLAGALMTIPVLVVAVGRIARRLPVPLRIAARDTARHGRRTGAAVAAAALALALPVTVATILLAEDALARDQPPLDPTHLWVSSGLRMTPADAPAVRQAIGSVVDVAVVAPMARAVPPSAEEDRPAGGPAGGVTAVTGRPGDAGGSEVAGSLVVGGPDLLRALDADEATRALRAGDVVVVGSGVLEGDVVHLLGADPPGGEPVVVPAVESGTPGFDALARFVVSPERAEELGLAVRSTGQVLYRTAAPVDAAALEEVREAVSSLPGVSVLGAEDVLADTGSVQAVLLGVAIPVALATLAVSTALVAAESRRNLAVLAAVGAAPGSRRRIVGSAALLLGLLAAVVAVPAGVVPVTVLLQLSEPAYPVVVPWATIGGVVAAAGIAGIGGALLSREPPPTLLLRPPG